MTTEMGYGMGGIEERICKIAREIGKRFDEITYVEIGVGEGATLSAIARELRMTKKKWRAIGVELPNGYSFNQKLTIDIAARRSLPLAFVNPYGIVHPAWEMITVYFKDSQSFLTENWNEPIHFALIDGCHGKPCVIQDFLAVEAFAVQSAIVMFHDFGEDQRGHFQPHCPTGLDVRGAVQDLGLLSGKRPGWQLTETLTADRLQGGWDMGVFIRSQEDRDHV